MRLDGGLARVRGVALEADLTGPTGLGGSLQRRRGLGDGQSGE